MMGEFKINRDRFDDAKNKLGCLRKQLGAMAPEPTDGTSVIRHYNQLLKQRDVLTRSSNISLDISIPRSSDAFMECFGKFIFQTKLELYNFENKYYTKLKKVFSIPGEIAENQNCSNKKSQMNNKSIKASLEDQPGPSGEPPSKKKRTDTADIPVRRRRRPVTIELSSSEDSDSDDSY